MADGVQWDIESARRIAAVVYRVEALAREVLGHYSVKSSRGTPIKWRPAINASDEEIPAWGIVAIDGSTTVDEVRRAKLYKPSTTWRRVYGAIGPEPVEPGGHCGVTLEPAWVLCNGSPTTGIGLGPKPDSFMLWEGYPSTANVVQLIDSGQNIVEVHFQQIREFWGKLNSSVSQGGTAAVSIYAGTFGSETDTGIDATGIGFPAMAGATNDKVNVFSMNGRFEGYPRTC